MHSCNTGRHPAWQADASLLSEPTIPGPLQVEFSLCHALPTRNGLLDACNELGVR